MNSFSSKNSWLLSIVLLSSWIVFTSYIDTFSSILAWIFFEFGSIDKNLPTNSRWGTVPSSYWLWSDCFTLFFCPWDINSETCTPIDLSYSSRFLSEVDTCCFCSFVFRRRSSMTLPVCVKKSCFREERVLRKLFLFVTLSVTFIFLTTIIFGNSFWSFKWRGEKWTSRS